MTTLVAALCAIAVSVAAIGYLLVTDEKRRRVFRLGAASALPRSGVVGWLVVLAPSVALLWLGQVSAFLVWFGAMTVSSWLIVSRAPR